MLNITFLVSNRLSEILKNKGHVGKRYLFSWWIQRAQMRSCPVSCYKISDCFLFFFHYLSTNLALFLSCGISVMAYCLFVFAPPRSLTSEVLCSCVDVGVPGVVLVSHQDEARSADPPGCCRHRRSALPPVGAASDLRLQQGPLREWCQQVPHTGKRLWSSYGSVRLSDSVCWDTV